MMEANLSNALINDRILKMDLVSQYGRVCDLGMQLQSRVKSFGTQHSNISPPVEDDTEIHLSSLEIEGIAFMVAFLLVLVIRVSFLISNLLFLPYLREFIQRGPQDYIRDQVAAIQADVYRKYPLAASVHILYDVVFPSLVSLLLFSHRTPLAFLLLTATMIV